MSDVLHCVVPATNFSGCEELLGGEEMSRQLLLCQRNFTESKQSIDLPIRFFAELPSSRTDFQPSFPYARSGVAYEVFFIFSHLNPMLGETHFDFGTMVDNVVHQAIKWHIEEITDIMINAAGFTPTLAPHNPEALTYHGEGGDMRVAQLTLIAGPKHQTTMGRPLERGDVDACDGVELKT
jgi:hypothetical protein